MHHFCMILPYVTGHICSPPISWCYVKQFRYITLLNVTDIYWPYWVLLTILSFQEITLSATNNCQCAVPLTPSTAVEPHLRLPLLESSPSKAPAESVQIDQLAQTQTFPLSPQEMLGFWSPCGVFILSSLYCWTLTRSAIRYKPLLLRGMSF